MSQQSKTEKGIGHPFGEEDPPYAGRNIGEGVSHATNDHILEEAGVLRKWRLILDSGEISFTHQLERESESCQKRSVSLLSLGSDSRPT